MVSPTLNLRMVFVDPMWVINWAPEAAVVNAAPKARTFCSGEYSVEASEIAMLLAVVPCGMTTITQNSCVSEAPLVFCIERDHRSPVSVKGNTAAACKIVTLFELATVFWETTINALSIGRRAARITFPPVRRLFALIERYRPQPGGIFVTIDGTRGHRHKKRKNM